MNTEENLDIHLDIFEGPLDLLLFLIKKNNLDIYDIPIAQITQEYLKYLDVMKELNLDVAGEFLVMASTLMQIKAKTLLPEQKVEGQEDQGPDPAADLIAKIAEYQKYKEASQFLNQRFDVYKDVYYRGSPVFADSEKVLNLELFELLNAVKRAFDKLEDKGGVIVREEFPIEKKMDKILSLLGTREWILLDDVFVGETKRLGVITCFMAMLELMKLRRIIARQDENFSEIRVYLRPPQEEQQGESDGTGRTA